MSMDDYLQDVCNSIIKNRSRIIEYYIQFWAAVNVPEDRLTPEYLADNFCLYRQTGINGIEEKIWLDFKDRHEFIGKKLKAAMAVIDIVSHPLYSTEDHKDHRRFLAAMEIYRKAMADEI